MLLVKLTSFIICLCLLLFVSAPAAAGEKIKVAVIEKLAQRYKLLLSENEGDVTNISEVTGENSTRGLVQLVIIKQALYKGGLDVDFDFILTPNSTRSNALLRSGDAVISPHLGLIQSQPKETFLSSVVIESRTLTKGVYGLASNKALMEIKSIADLKPLTGVLQTSWSSDIKTLKKHDITQIDLVNKYHNIFTRIAHRGLDYTLLELSYNKELIRYSNKIQLHPVPNIVIKLEGTRHFFISKKHADGKRVFQALEKGLQIMKEEGTIQKYFKKIKVIRDDLEHFKVLNE